MAQTPTKPAKPTKKKNSLHQEVRLLRSLAISLVGEDEEGVYRPEFVKEILKAAGEKPTLRFTDKKSFLKQLRKA